MRLAGGGGGKGGGSSEPREPQDAANTLFSTSVGNATFFLCQGPILGFVDSDPLKSIYFDRTPPLTPEGDELIEGVSIEWRLGTPSQPIMSQFRQQTTFPVSVEVKSSLADGLTRQFGGEDFANVLIRYRIPQLFEIDAQTGDTNLTNLHFQVYLSTDNGPFILQHNLRFFDKTDQDFEDTIYVGLPPSNNLTWAVRVVKVTPDSTSVRLQNQLIWVDYTLVDRQGSLFSGVAVASVQVSGENFNSIPAFSADMRGLADIPIPHNFDGLTRTLTGTFDGSLVPGYTNDPAWVLWWLLTSSRQEEGFGVPAAYLDVWSFYEASQRNNEKVQSDFGDIEPRYSYNRYLASRRSSLDFRDEILASMHCRIAQVGAKYVLIQDRPKTEQPVLINQASCVVTVSDGVESDPITYQFTELSNMYTVIEVEFINTAFWEYDSTGPIKDDTAIARWGYRYKKIKQDRAMTAGEARREARWQLYTSLFQNKVLFTLGDYAFNLAIGKRFSFADAYTNSIRASGRIIAVSSNWVDLDAPVDAAEIGGNPILLTSHPVSGEQQQNQIASIVGIRINLAVPFASLPQQMGLWAIQSNSIQLPVYTCVEIKPRKVDAGFVYDIVGVEYKEAKWSYIDTGATPGGTLLELPAIRIPKRPINLSYREAIKDTGDRITNRIDVFWGVEAVDRGFVNQWDVGILRRGEHAWAPLRRVSTQRFELLDLDPGFYTFRVRAVSPYRTAGPYAFLSFSVQSRRRAIGNVENFALSVIGQGDTIRLSWDPALDPIVIHAGSIQIRHSAAAATLWAGSSIIATEAGTSTSVIVPSLAGFYSAKWIVPSERLESPVEATISTTGTGLVRRNFVNRICEDSSNFMGQKDNVTFTGSGLILTDISRPGRYEWAQAITFNEVQTVDLTTDVAWTSIEFSDVLDLYDDPPGALHDDSEPGELHDSLNRFELALYQGNLYDDYDGPHDDDFPGLLHDDTLYAGDVSFAKEIQLSLDGVSFNDWVAFQPGRYTFRAARFANEFVSRDGVSNILLTQDCINVDALDRVASGTAVSSEFLPTLVSFSLPFNVAPEGVEITIQEGDTVDQGYQSGDYHLITSLDRLGFSIEFRNNAAITGGNPDGRVTRKFYWLTEAF